MPISWDDYIQDCVNTTILNVTKKKEADIMPMSRQDFDRIADVIRRTGEDAMFGAQQELLSSLANRLCDTFAHFCERFDAHAFICACSLNQISLDQQRDRERGGAGNDMEINRLPQAAPHPVLDHPGGPIPAARRRVRPVLIPPGIYDEVANATNTIAALFEGDIPAPADPPQVIHSQTWDTIDPAPSPLTRPAGVRTGRMPPTTE